MICNPLNQGLLWIVFIIVYISKVENTNHLHLGFVYITIIIICREELVNCKNLFTILYIIFFNRMCSNKRNASINELFTFIRRSLQSRSPHRYIDIIISKFYFTFYIFPYCSTYEKYVPLE